MLFSLSYFFPFSVFFSFIFCLNFSFHAFVGEIAFEFFTHTKTKKTTEISCGGLKRTLYLVLSGFLCSIIALNYFFRGRRMWNEENWDFGTFLMRKFCRFLFENEEFVWLIEKFDDLIRENVSIFLCQDKFLCIFQKFTVKSGSINDFKGFKWLKKENN